MAEEIHLSLKSGGRKDTFLTELVTTIGLEQLTEPATLDALPSNNMVAHIHL